MPMGTRFLVLAAVAAMGCGGGRGGSGDDDDEGSPLDELDTPRAEVADAWRTVEYCFSRYLPNGPTSPDDYNDDLNDVIPTAGAAEWDVMRDSACSACADIARDPDAFQHDEPACLQSVCDELSMTDACATCDEDLGGHCVDYGGPV